MTDGYTWALVGLSLASTAAITAFLFTGHLRGANATAAGASQSASGGAAPGGAVAWRSQRLFLRIGLAAPLLALLSAVALLVPGSALECELVQSVYEGYTLYLFFALLLLHLGGEVSHRVHKGRGSPLVALLKHLKLLLALFFLSFLLAASGGGG